MNINKKFGDERYTWLNFDSNNTREVFYLQKQYNINEEILTYSLDENERAHVEYEELSNTFLLIYNVPYKKKVDGHYETGPMSFIVKDNHLITISSDNTEYIIATMEKYLNNNPNISLFKFLFSSLFLISDAFFPLVENVDAERKLVNNKLREKTTNKNILALSDLEIGMVYLVTASKQNSILLEQLKVQAIYRRLTDLEKEQLDDALIEARQLVEMTQLASQILQQLSGTYNNILNNNLNDTMKILTFLSLLLAIPTLVSGFFGMNMPLPLEQNSYGWVISLFITLVLWVGLALLLRNKIK